MSSVEGQMGRLREVNTHELGEVIDMIKDLEEAMYYHSITEAMAENGIENYVNKMYFDEEAKPVGTAYQKTDRSSEQRKKYLEAKQKHEDQAIQLKELEAYMNDLSTDIVEMINDASVEERQYLERKMIQLANKVGKLN